jgi:hypothetical protein
MSVTITHEFQLADIEDERLEVTVEKDGSIRLMWWEEVPRGDTGIKKVSRFLYIQRSDFENIAATVEAWDDALIRKGLSNE